MPGSVNLRTLVVLALASAGATGCLRPARAIRELPPGEWTQRLGNERHAPFLDERVPARVQVAWDESLGRGLPAMAIIQDDVVISVVSGGGLVTASARTGRRFWSRRVDGAIAGQALRVDGRVFFATQRRNGSVYALDLPRGRRLWSRRLGSSAAAEPAIADGRIYVATQRGEVLALDSANGSVAWRTRIGTPAPQPPIALHDALLIAARDTIVTIRRSDGSVLARHAIAGMPSAPPALRGDTIIVAMHPGTVAAYVDGGARELWRHTLPAPVLAAPIVAHDGVYVLTRNAELYRLNPYTAARIVALDGAATESLTITADGALIGTLDGRLVYVRMDGTTVWEQRVGSSIRAPAAVREGAVYVSTLQGRIVKLIAG